ncbi:hypothetical protein M8C21_016966 [Ambrosia artemisiifolia]|uniref:Uncharacterized protein n=1 Tax=Ambrosia artemisiifolia TaxID=4212 RepID=A0AAD5D4B5_AMBAR|nr:hypothetical protein M8C21_016966 [Ambrosia artemisiifolia]
MKAQVWGRGNEMNSHRPLDFRRLVQVRFLVNCLRDDIGHEYLQRKIFQRQGLRGVLIQSQEKKRFPDIITR